MSDETKPDTPDPGKPDESKEAADTGTFRRPLIRASLPHPDGAQSNQREAPVFTMHEQPARGNNWGKGGRGGSNGNGNGNGNVQAKKHGRRRGGHGRNANDQQGSGNQANGNQLRPEGRSGSKSRSSRRNRGRSR